MTPNAFRRLALGLEGAVEEAHHGHPDFRVVAASSRRSVIPDRRHGRVMLTPEQQGIYVRDCPSVFVLAAGTWGAQGSTTVRLAAASVEVLGEALTLAWQNAVAKGPARARAQGRSPKDSNSGRAN